MTIVIDTLRQIISAAKVNDITGRDWHDRGEAGTAVFSYDIDFTALWGLASSDGFQCIANRLCQAKGKRNVVIVWDSIPKGNTGAVNTGRYLTPIDWAVALSLNIRSEAERINKGKEESIELPALRIVILDLGSNLVPDADAIKSLPHLKIEMPWIELFSPAADGRFDTFVQEIVGQRTDIKFMNHFPLTTDVIERLWQSALVKPSEPGNHHAIANLIGPLLLLGEDTKEDRHVKALRRQMSALGLIPQEAKNDKNKLPKERALFPWIKSGDLVWEKMNELIKDDRHLRLIMVDDQFRQGWGKMLCWAVNIGYKEESETQSLMSIGKSGKISVRAASSVDWLVRKIKNAEDQRFVFRMTDDNDDTKMILEILFLDLRLFSGQPLAREIEFFNDLIGIAKKFTEKRNLPWPGFDTKQIKLIETWCNPQNTDKKREDAEYIQALTLLPRILSLTDMSLPIILFSSTGRRDLTEWLKPYGNIITIFDKPRLSIDISEDIAEQTKVKFTEAIDLAMTLLQGQRAVKALMSKAAKQLTVSTAEGASKYVEIFIDESGTGFENDSFVVGGIVIVHTDKNQGDDLHKAMQATNVTYTDADGNTITRNLIWCGNNRLDKRLHDNADKEVATLTQILPDIAKVFKDYSEMYFPVVLRTQVNQRAELNILHNEHLDNIYLRLFKDLLDAILYELLPWHLGRTTNITCSVHAGTRRRTKYRKADFTIDEKKELQKNFGIKVEREMRNGNYDYYTALAPTSFIPIVSSVIMARTNADTDKLIIESALGVTLAYQEKTPYYNFRHAHFVADLIAHVDYISIYKADRDIIKEFSSNGRMVDKFDGEFKAALDASNYIDAKDLVNALFSAYYATSRYDSNIYPESIIPIILARVIQNLNDLKGEQFVQFALLLDGWHRNGLNAPPRK